MDPVQKKFLDQRFKEWYVPGWKKLLKLLQSHGGLMLVPQPETPHDVTELLQHGRIFPTTGLKLRRGEPSGCHRNAAQLWAKHENLSVVTGYALSRDLWRQHSWLWDNKRERIMETTVQFEMYFGRVLAEVDLLRFILGNDRTLVDAPTKRLLYEINKNRIGG